MSLTSGRWSRNVALRNELQRGDFVPLVEEQPTTPLKLSGLAITEDHYLVVGVTDPAGLLIFDLHTGQEPRQVLWPNGVAFAPFDSRPDRAAASTFSIVSIRVTGRSIDTST